LFIGSGALEKLAIVPVEYKCVSGFIAVGEGLSSGMSTTSGADDFWDAGLDGFLGATPGEGLERGPKDNSS
jgi:hypothetical protein